MSDALRNTIPVSQPEYCTYTDPVTDEPVTVSVYNWMGVRAAGPNVLKDTVLCGTTHIENLISDSIPATICYSCVKLNNGNDTINDQLTGIALGIGFDTINGLNPPHVYNWTIDNVFSAANESLNLPPPFVTTPYITYPSKADIPSPLFQNGLFAIQNNQAPGSGDARLTVKCTLTGQCYVLIGGGARTADMIVDVFVSKTSDPGNSASIIAGTVNASIATIAIDANTPDVVYPRM